MNRTPEQRLDLALVEREYHAEMQKACADYFAQIDAGEAPGGAWSNWLFASFHAHCRHAKRVLEITRKAST